MEKRSDASGTGSLQGAGACDDRATQSDRTEGDAKDSIMKIYR
jgi:hypothetical protein